MSPALEKLIDSLQVEQLDNYLFRGYTPQPSLPRIYGGQVVAQAMNAALRTVDPSRHIHSLHAYFLRPGDPSYPILFDVDPIRDGGSFTTRRVVAKQRGKAIFNCALSFQTPEAGLQHQTALPAVSQPQELEPYQELLLRTNKDRQPHPLNDPEIFAAWDIRKLHRRDQNNPQPDTSATGIWFRTQGRLPDDPILHKTLLAYISDYGFMGTAMRPHPVSFLSPGMQGASLDHAMWFHSDCRVDDWVLHAMDSPRAAGGRGLNLGNLYSSDGTLVASTVQEGLMRINSATRTKS